MKTLFDIKKLGFNSTDYNMPGMTRHFLNGRYRGFNLQSIIHFPRGMNEKRILLYVFYENFIYVSLKIRAGQGRSCGQLKVY